MIQITFDESGRVQTIKNYDLSDAQNIAMVARITPTSGKELTVLEQILGNVGKFSGRKAADQSGRADRRRHLIRLSKRAKNDSPNKKAPVLRPGLLRWFRLRSQCASTASSSRATMLVILIIGFTAGPDVSL